MGSGPDQQHWLAQPGNVEYTTPVKLHTTSEEAMDKWSVPRAQGCSQFSSSNLQTPQPRTGQNDPSQGIAIPAFLQPLLGMDFVPYMPTPDQPQKYVATVSGLTDEDLEDLLGPEETATTMTKRPDIEHEDRFSTPADFSNDVGCYIDLQQPATEEEDDNSSTKRSKTKRRLSKSFLKLVKGRKRADSASKLLQRNRTGTWHGEADPLESSQSTNGTNEQVIPNHLEWLQQQQSNLSKHQSHLETVQAEAQVMQTKTQHIHQRVGQVQTEISSLQKAMAQAEQKLKRELMSFEDTRSELSRLEKSALQASEAVVESMRQIRLGPNGTIMTPKGTRRVPIEFATPKVNNAAAVSVEIPIQLSGPTKPLRQRAATAPAFPTTRSSSFMRVHDLEMDSRHDCATQDDVMADNSNHESSSFSSSTTSLNNGAVNGFIFVDHNVTPILENLTRLGYEKATDETSKFAPTRDTERLLTKYKSGTFSDNSLKDWPIPDWKAVHGKDVLVWTGGVDHKGFGSDWPVVKTRGLVETAPQTLLEYLMDSSNAKAYNKMSQGREDILSIQKGIGTTAKESPYGFAGDCKIIKSLNKPRLLPKTIEMLSLMHSRPIQNAPGSYMTVSRSVFEDDSGEHKCTRHIIRSEMLLGVIMVRPADEAGQVTELTTITHVYSPGVPELLAKRAAPSSAQGMMRDIQNIFKR